MSAPTPSIMTRFAPPVATTQVVLAVTEPADPGKIVRPGLQEVITQGTHDGVIRAKDAKKGQTVRAWLHGAPRGAEYVIESVTPSKDGSTVTIAWVQPCQKPATEYKAAYRFYVDALAGKPVQKVSHVPALVAYEEV